MMVWFHGCLVATLLLPWVVAAETGGSAVPQDQRQVIEQLRQSEAKRFDAEEAACQSRFAVTRCVDAVRAERLKVKSNLNAQEAALNSADRQKAAQEQLDRIEEKSKNRRAEVSNEPRGVPEPTRPVKERVVPTVAPEQSAPPTKAENQSTARAARDRAAKVRAFNEKQAAAQERRAAVAKKIQSKASSARPLPVPP
jgi:colicin import membrane protein